MQNSDLFFFWGGGGGGGGEAPIAQLGEHYDHTLDRKVAG